MKDYYSVLGVDKNATDNDIKRAYRRLASQHHPDKGGDKSRFQEVQEAYSVLGDTEQRKRYDNPAMNFSGYTAQSGPHFNFNDIFEMFGARIHPDSGFHRQRQQRIQLWISLEDVAAGGPRPVSLATPQGQGTVELEIPAGIDDGDTFNYRNMLPGGGDLMVQYRIRPNSSWRRNNDNVEKDLILSIWDLILGTEIDTATLIGGTVRVMVPAMTQPGTVLRIRGHGLPNKHSKQRGDIMLRVQARLPSDLSPSQLEQISTWRSQ